jgi:hypothetical protein
LLQIHSIAELWRNDELEQALVTRLLPIVQPYREILIPVPLACPSTYKGVAGAIGDSWSKIFSVVGQLNRSLTPEPIR